MRHENGPEFHFCVSLIAAPTNNFLVESLLVNLCNCSCLKGFDSVVRMVLIDCVSVLGMVGHIWKETRVQTGGKILLDVAMALRANFVFTYT